LTFLPMLFVGGGMWAGKQLSKKISSPKSTLVARLTADNSYQQFFHTKIDPLFGTKQRRQQMQEFSGTYSEKEADTNRRLGLALVNTKLAILGSVVYPPLSWVSAGGLMMIMWPLVQRNLKILIREKRLNTAWWLLYPSIVAWPLATTWSVV